MKTQKNIIILFLSILALGAATGCENKSSLANEAIESREDCTMLNPNIGKSATFSTRDHNVGGTATILSDCEIEITDFTFDGGGSDVRVYGALDESSFRGGINLSPEDLKDFGATGEPNFRDTFSVFLEEGTFFLNDPNNANPTADNQINALSIWCVPFRRNFGSLTFN